MKINQRRKYIGFICGFAALDIIINACINRGFDLPVRNQLSGHWIVDRDVLSWHEWRDLRQKYPIVLGLTWLFFTSGASLTLASDFNTSANAFYAIGSGHGGQGGQSGSTCCPCTGSTSGNGGVGGGGGAYAAITNYSAHGAGQVVSIQVGASDTWFDSTSVLLAHAAAGKQGGDGLGGVGTAKATGGNGGTGGLAAFGNAPSGGGGGGGGGAAGPNGNGSNGANGVNGTNNTGISSGGGPGGSGDGGHTAAAASGVQFGPNASSQFAGPGGGGNGGISTYGNSSGPPGGNAGFYGGGGGGGGGGSNTLPGFAAGNATQGLLAYSYTPSGAGHARSFATIIG